MTKAPRDLDEESLRAIARSFYAVRMARYALLLLFLAAFAVASLATDRPVVAAVLGLVVVALLTKAYGTRRRYLSETEPAPSGK